MSAQLKIALLQLDLAWENPSRNLENIDQYLVNLKEDTQLLLLPEMFTTGFSMTSAHLAEPMDGTTVNWMKRHAQTHDLYIGGSLQIKEDDKLYNRFVIVAPDGNVHQYDKWHAFSLAGEHEHFTRTIPVVDALVHGWKLRLQVCYDLRFPVTARNTSNYDCVVYVANWPAPRIHAWDTLLAARAIENMAYSIGLNRVGIDGSGMPYPGHSQVYDALGHPQGESPWTTAGVRYYSLKREHLDDTRSKLPFLSDRDDFTVEGDS